MGLALEKADVLWDLEPHGLRSARRRGAVWEKADCSAAIYVAEIRLARRKQLLGGIFLIRPDQVSLCHYMSLHRRKQTRLRGPI
jgi:hypothetical protein